MAGNIRFGTDGWRAIIADELHLLFYAGAREHYFDRHRADVQAILASIAR